MYVWSCHTNLQTKLQGLLHGIKEKESKMSLLLHDFSLGQFSFVLVMPVWWYSSTCTPQLTRVCMASYQSNSLLLFVIWDSSGDNFVEWNDGIPPLQLALLQQGLPRLLRVHNYIVQLQKYTGDKHTYIIYTPIHHWSPWERTYVDKTPGKYIRT